MITEQMEHLFYVNGYDKIATNLPEYAFYYHKEERGVIAIFVVDYRDGMDLSKDQYAHMKEKAVAFLRDRGETQVHMMSLILSGTTERAKELCVSDHFCWMVDTKSGRLIIHENQAPDFYGWKSILEEFLIDVSERQGSAEEKMTYVERLRAEWQKIDKPASLPWVSICLVAVNVIVFLLYTFIGDVLYNIGASGVREIAEDGSYYRMFTSMFLHADAQHLFNNMILLYCIGEIVERYAGHAWYTVVYFLSGIAGDVFSMAYELLTENYYTSVGASGAVFGIEGALLFLVILHHGRLEHIRTGRLLFAILFSLYCGFTSAGINNAAHVGGVLMGFAAMAVIALICPRIRAGKDRSGNEN